MSYKVLVPQPVSSVGTDYLIDKGYEIKNGSGFDIETIKKEVVGCDAILLRTALITKEILDAGKNLKVIGRHGIGVDNIDVESATQKGIQVTYAPFSNANTVAEFTLSCILAVARKTVVLDKYFREKGFSYRDVKPKIDELSGKTVGIIGLGKIGKLVGKKCNLGFDMKILGYDPFVKESDFEYPIELTKDIDRIFKEADFVCLNMPLNDDTRNLVNKDKIGLMKKSAYLINAARGEVLVEKDLYNALKNNEIFGAALDVFEKEPTDDNNPLFELDNITLSPHIASHSEESMDRMSLHAAIGIDEVLSNKEISWPVNKL